LAVVAHDLDDRGGGVEAREAAEVERALGLARADEDAAVAGAKGVDVPRADEVGGRGAGVDGGPGGRGPRRGRGAGREAAAGGAAEGRGEGRAAGRGVDGGRGVEFEPVAVGLGEREAEIAACL